MPNDTFGGIRIMFSLLWRAASPGLNLRFRDVTLSLRIFAANSKRGWNYDAIMQFFCALVPAACKVYFLGVAQRQRRPSRAFF